jgi:hypothetical protein
MNIFSRSSCLVLCACAVAAVTAPSAARAAGANLPLSVGIGAYVPASAGTPIESVGLPPGVSVKQQGNVAIEFAVEPNLLSGGYRIDAGFISSRETVSTPGNQPVSAGPMAPIFTPGSESVTQIPVTLEQDAGVGHLVRLGGGLGYDFVNVSGSNNGGAGIGRSASGFVADAFGQIGLGSSAAFEVKYYLTQHSALNGFVIGLTTRL